MTMHSYVKFNFSSPPVPLSTIKQLVKTNRLWLFILFCLSYTSNRYMHDPIIDACRYTIRLIIDCDKIIQLSDDNNMD